MPSTEHASHFECGDGTGLWLPLSTSLSIRVVPCIASLRSWSPQKHPEYTGTSDTSAALTQDLLQQLSSSCSPPSCSPC